MTEGPQADSESELGLSPGNVFLGAFTEFPLLDFLNEEIPNLGGFQLLIEICHFFFAVLMVSGEYECKFSKGLTLVSWSLKSKMTFRIVRYSDEICRCRRMTPF